MPNDITNELIFSNCSSARFRDILSEIQNDEEDFGSIDFNKIVPQPEGLFQGPIGPREREIYKDNNWYDWNIAHWGTKWNAYLSDENNEIKAEHWLQKASEKGNVYAMYFLYQCYRDGRIKDHKSKKMKYLLMAVDKNFAYAEYDFGKYLESKNDTMAIEYLRQAAKHGCVQAEYAIGKRMLQQGQAEEGLAYLESAASKDSWSKFNLGLLYCYRLGEWEKGIEHLRSAADSGYEPARNAINNIKKGLNAKIITGICDLFYYASRIIDDRAESEYPHPAFDSVEARAKKEDQAKRMGIAYSDM